MSETATITARKKHINIPDWLDVQLKEALKRGDFTSESDAFRTGLLLAVALPILRRKSPGADLEFYKQIEDYIVEAKGFLQKYDLANATVRLRSFSNVLAYRAALSSITDGEFDRISSLRTVNSVLNDCIASMQKLSAKDLKRTDLAKGIEQLELVEHLDFLATVYRDLAKTRHRK